MKYRTVIKIEKSRINIGITIVKSRLPNYAYSKIAVMILKYAEGQ